MQEQAKARNRENMMLGKIEGSKTRMRELDSITASIDMNLNKIWEIVKG